MNRAGPFVALILLSYTAVGQDALCPFPEELRRRAADEVLSSPAVREFVRDNRARVLRIGCEIRTKEREEAIAIAYVVNYGDGSAMELAFRPGDVERAEARRLPGRVQSSEEEREKARAIIREGTGLSAGAVLEGGFVVDPPPGASPGRYLEFHIATPDRARIESEVIVDMGRRRIAARRGD